MTIGMCTSLISVDRYYINLHMSGRGDIGFHSFNNQPMSRRPVSSCLYSSL